MKTLLIATQALVIGASAAMAQSTAGTETPTPPPSKERMMGAQDGKGPHGDRRGGPGHHGQMMPGMMGQGYAMMPGYGYVMVPMLVPMGPQMMPMMPMQPGMMPHGGDYDGKHHGKSYGKRDHAERGAGHGMRPSFFGELMEDGQITREEFDAKAEEIFGRLDANGDGVISEDEMPGRRFGKGFKPGANAEPAPSEEAPSDN